MLAKETDTKVFFYKLVNQQRSGKNTSTEVLLFEGQTFTTTEGVANVFSEHFRNLATIESLAPSQEEPFRLITAKEVMNIVRSFKLNKAQDIFGLSAEHLKYAPDILFQVPAPLMNSILHSGHVPPL